MQKLHSLQLMHTRDHLTTDCRDDYKFSEMIGQKPLIATLVPYLIRHPYIALERQCISGRTLIE